MERNLQIARKYLTSLLLLLLLLPPNVVARETPPDYNHVVLMNVLFAADHSSTLYIANHPDEYGEWKYNLVLPTHPSTGDVNRYFLAVGLVVNGLVYVLPDEWSDGLMVLTETVQVFTVGNNIGIGVRFSLP